VKRLEGWDIRLLDFIASRRREPFKWGKRENDCCSFANGAAMAVTGKDIMKDVRNYRSEAGAARALVEAGVSSFEELVDRLLPAQPVAFARRGDLALAQKGNETVLTVVEGDFLIGPDLDGLMRLPRSAAVKSWQVGDTSLPLAPASEADVVPVLNESADEDNHHERGGV
jgi:hypothetical protein